MHGVHSCLLFTIPWRLDFLREAADLIEKSYIEIADTVRSTVLHKPLTPQISALFSPL